MNNEVQDINFSDLMRLVYAYMRIKDPAKRERLIAMAETQVERK